MPSIQNEKSPDAADGKDGPGFGVIKIIIGVVLLLIVGSGLLMKLVCGKHTECEPGYTCISAAERVGKRSTRMRNVCVKSSKL